MTMQSFLTKEIPKWVQVLMFVCFMAFLIWNDLFPLSAHSDLRFQAAGETLELLMLSATLGWLRLASLRARKYAISEKANYAANTESATAFSMIFIVMDWRKFFPGDHFQFSAGLHTIYGALLAGAFFGLFPVANNWEYKKPSKDEERLVV
jgi:hypothetical protein